MNITAFPPVHVRLHLLFFVSSFLFFAVRNVCNHSRPSRTPPRSGPAKLSSPTTMNTNCRGRRVERGHSKQETFCSNFPSSLYVRPTGSVFCPASITPMPENVRVGARTATRVFAFSPLFGVGHNAQ